MSDERTFTAKIQTLRRIAVPRVVLESLGVREGDIVEVHLKKIISMKGKEKV